MTGLLSSTYNRILRRRFWWIAIAAAAVAVSALLITRDRPSEPPPDPPAATGLAQSACLRLRRIEDLIRKNGAVEVVMTELEAAERDAHRAASADSRWVALAGGVSALKVSLQDDSARAARVAIDVIRTECERREIVDIETNR